MSVLCISDFLHKSGIIYRDLKVKHSVLSDKLVLVAKCENYIYSVANIILVLCL